MKEKTLTITSNNITQKQWSNLILELNLIKKAWAGYATLNIKAPGIRKIIAKIPLNITILPYPFLYLYYLGYQPMKFQFHLPD